MNSFFTQVSSSIRILGWNRDASARATHLKAADGNVPSATIERKSMSTKTSIKRIALVAAAALTIGGFSAVSAHAADNAVLFPAVGDGASFTSPTGAGTTLTGVAADGNSVQVGVVTGTSGILTISGSTFSSVTASVGATVATGGATVSLSSTTGTAYVTIPTPTVGSITVNYKKQTSPGINSATVTESVVITVNAAASSGIFSAAKSTVYLASGETSVAVAADASVVAASTVNLDTAVATIQVHLADSLGAAYKDSITATITSGPGVIFGSNDSKTVGVNTTSFASTAGSPLYSTTVAGVSSNGGEIRDTYFGIFANGQTGTSLVTIKNSAGTVLATKSITFYSLTPASVKATVLKAYVLNSNTATNKVFSVVVSDSAGNPISNPSITMTVPAGSTVGVAGTCVYNSTDAVSYCTAAANTTQVTAATDATETYTFTAGTATTTAAVKFVSGVLTTVSVAGPASADPGTKTNYTLTALGANGSPLPDGAYVPGAIFTNADPSTNASLVAIPFGKGETITLAAGIATDYTYAPFSGSLSASWTVAGTLGATANTAASYDGSAFTAAGVAKALAGTSVAADDVAVTANSDATAAANAATDAANAAADAADQATAAVTELQTQVVALIAAIQKQITALTVLINKIKVKVKA